MKKALHSLILLASTSPLTASAYFDIGLGAQHSQLKGKNLDYQDSQAVAGQIAIGKRWTNWDLGLLGTYGFGRQNNFKQVYPDKTVTDDFNYHSATLGPILAYHMVSDSQTWSWAPFVGAHVSFLGLESSTEFRDPASGDKENISSNNFGYGGSAGMHFQQYRPNSTWLEAINYRLTYSYSRFRETDAIYDINQRERRYRDETPDKLVDHTVTFTVGISLGSKLWNKGKAGISRLIDSI